ncbi:hypothetical protein BJ742DRAFT_749830 [Cladochytrium replicatum]|nr:hypothetical protein BJ742DRAFT_749830 [Cladochytrium replicatum]
MCPEPVPGCMVLLMVNTTSREATPAARAQFADKVNRCIFELVSNQNQNYKMGGICVIEALVDCDFEEANARITHLTNYVRRVLPGTDARLTLAAARALGRLAIPGGSLTVALVDFEMKRALEWLQGDRNDSRRLASVCIIRSLAMAAPTLVYDYVLSILDLIWTAIRDQKVKIREVAAEALRHSLDISVASDPNTRRTIFKRVWDETKQGFKFGRSETIHGSLLAAQVLLIRPDKYVLARIKDIAPAVLKYKEHRDILIRRAVFVIIPLLARSSPDFFSSNYLTITVKYLLTHVANETDRTEGKLLYKSSFLALGYLSSSVGMYIRSYLDDILRVIIEGMSLGRYSPHLNAVFTCVGQLAIALGPWMVEDLAGKGDSSNRFDTLLEQMFSMGLSEALRDTLVDLIYNIPSIETVVQQRLLDMLVDILSKVPATATLSLVPEEVSIENDSANIAKLSPQRQSKTSILQATYLESAESILLALNTLGSFHFGDLKWKTMLETSPVLRDHILKCTGHDDPRIRKAAAQTCCRLMAVPHPIGEGDIYNSQRSRFSFEVLDTTVRKEVLVSLDQRFDPYLAHSEVLELLFNCVNDNHFENQDISMGTLARLSGRNPGIILPFMRNMLEQLLAELQFSGISQQREQSATLLGQLITGTTAFGLIFPYIDHVLSVLLPKCRDSSPDVATRALDVIGRLGGLTVRDSHMNDAGDASMTEFQNDALSAYMNQILDVIIETLEDQRSSSKRQAAAKALGSIALGMGYVLEGNEKYHSALPLVVNIIKTEQNAQLRGEVIRTLGILGALDPFKYKMITDGNVSISGIMNDPQTPNLPVLSPASDEYVPAFAIGALLRIMRDPSLTNYYAQAVNAVVTIFKSLGVKCCSFLPYVIPPFIVVIRRSQPQTLDFYFSQLAIVINLVKQHIRNHVGEIKSIIKDLWLSSPQSAQFGMLTVIEAIGASMPGELKDQLNPFLSNILDLLERSTTTPVNPGQTQKILSCLVTLGANWEGNLRLLIPAVVRCMERKDLPVSTRQFAISSIAQLSRKLYLAEHASRIMTPLIAALSDPGTQLTAADAICTILCYIPTRQTSVYLPLIIRPIKSGVLTHQTLKKFLTDIQESNELPADYVGVTEVREQHLSVNAAVIIKSLDSSHRKNREDWGEWLKHLATDLLKESPSYALRACSALASIYSPLARELFNVAFVSCWRILDTQHEEANRNIPPESAEPRPPSDRDLVLQLIETALASQTIPPEVLQILLNLAEYMERDADRPLPVKISNLITYAKRCHAYAKALYYSELTFLEGYGGDTYQSHPAQSAVLASAVENLIDLNDRLNQQDSAKGMLEFVKDDIRASWYEKLNRWEDGFAAYTRQLQEDPTSLESILGQMRCLHSLGDWEGVSKVAKERWMLMSHFGLGSDTWEDKLRNKAAASLAASAAWSLGRWDLLHTYVDMVMAKDTPDGAFYRAIQAIQQGQYDMANSYIVNTRNLLDKELVALLGESYERAYAVVVRVQMLAELEQIVIYKRTNSALLRARIKSTMDARLKKSEYDVEYWQRLLKVRSLVFTPEQDMDVQIKFSSLCRKSGRFGLSMQVLSKLLGGGRSDFSRLNVNGNDPKVVYACLKHMWGARSRETAIQNMKQLASVLSSRVNVSGSSVSTPPGSMIDPYAVAAAALGGEEKMEQLKYLLSKCYLKIGDWQLAVARDVSEADLRSVLRYHELAKDFGPDHYKAWHAWSMSNLKVVELHERQERFIRAVVLLEKGTEQQDALRLVTLWFKYGANVQFSVCKQLTLVKKLIARIHSKNDNTRRNLHELVARVGKHHPQALIYPLTVATKAPVLDRRRAATEIMERLRDHHAKLVEQALLVSDELVRVSILWHEMWADGIDEALKSYQDQQSLEAMLEILMPLHVMLDKGPETMEESQFVRSFGVDLREAVQLLLRYRQMPNSMYLKQAFSIYRQVLRSIHEQLPQMMSFELHFASPKLLEAANLDIAIPGSYRVDEPVVCISRFDPIFTVLSSKQRPRKMQIKGSDGNTYGFLLKGHEDLRQDERVMQLFGLVNMLLESNQETFKRHLNIVHYSVIPLSQNSGLIGWVPNLDTMHGLIKDYRKQLKIHLDLEYRLMNKMAANYEMLPLLGRVEVFEFALENTTGEDLRRILWLKSRNAEAWLERRTNFTRSLAVMSMAGYMLGLGDRHPSNLMVHRTTGSVIHVDFGDCFEVAMHRDRYPEKVPFRLTRMLIKAMEVSGIHGNFKATCRLVMQVLRDNTDSLMAALEAFVYDPLINWKLMTPSPAIESRKHHRLQHKHLQFGGELSGFIISSDLLVVSADDNSETPNSRALAVIGRVSDKLTGRDIKPNVTMDVPEQVERLIQQATSVENLCQLYVGWCSFW